jgi:hypothetical protein
MEEADILYGVTMQEQGGHPACSPSTSRGSRSTSGKDSIAKIHTEKEYPQWHFSTRSGRA